MRITGHDMNTISKAQTQAVVDSPKPSTTGTGRPATHPDVSSDQVDLAGQNGLLSQAQTASADSRSARIEQLRALVQSGQYNVDTGALSQALVNSALKGY